MTIPLQVGIIYGPVNSRRLGRSLGLNLLPRGKKICTFNCVYCQYGWTKFYARSLPDSRLWPNPDIILQALRTYLKDAETSPPYLTFSGNGEPTLHPNFPDIVNDVIAIRNELAPSAQTAILSNSSTVNDASIVSALHKLDVRIMKLDCGDPECFKRYNQPVPEVTFSEVIQGLTHLNQVTIQSLFTDGPAGNSTEINIDNWIERLRSIKPVTVQIYSLDRGVPSNQIFQVAKKKLETIGDRVRSHNINAEVFHR